MDAQADLTQSKKGELFRDLHLNADLKAIGVRRISIGGSLSRAVFALIRGAAQEMRERGSFTFAEQQISDSELCNFFAAFENGS